VFHSLCVMLCCIVNLCLTIAGLLLSPAPLPTQRGGSQGSNEEENYQNGENLDDDDEPLSIADSCPDDKEFARPPKPRSRASSAQSNAGRQIPQPIGRGVNAKVG
jgi:hypothetical protein